MNIIIDQKEKEKERRNWTSFKASHEVAHQLIVDKNKRMNACHIVALTWMLEFIKSNKISLTGTDPVTGEKCFWVSTNEFLEQVGEMCNCYTVDQAKKFMSVMSEIYYVNPLTGKKEKLIRREVIDKKKSMYFPNWVLINFLLSNPYEKEIEYPTHESALHYNINLSDINTKVQLFVQNSILKPERNTGICAKNESICAPTAQTCAKNEEKISNSARNRTVTNRTEKQKGNIEQTTTANDNVANAPVSKEPVAPVSCCSDSQSVAYGSLDSSIVSQMLSYNISESDAKKILRKYGEESTLIGLQKLENKINNKTKISNPTAYLRWLIDNPDIQDDTTDDKPTLPPIRQGKNKDDDGIDYDSMYGNNIPLPPVHEYKGIVVPIQGEKLKTKSFSEYENYKYQCPKCKHENQTFNLVCGNCEIEFDYSGF